MKTSSKILSSIPSVLSLAYAITFVFPERFLWLVPSMRAYYWQVGILNGSLCLVVFLLILQLWKLPQFSKKEKTDWTWILIIFNVYSVLIFVWYKMKKKAIVESSDLPENEFVKNNSV